MNSIFKKESSASSEEKFDSPEKPDTLYTGMENRRLIKELKQKAGSHIDKRKNAAKEAMNKLKEKIEADNKLTNPERHRI